MMMTPQHHHARVSAFRCQKCGKVSTENTDFREVIGNVFIPDSGGLVGNNFRDIKDMERSHPQQREGFGEPNMILFERTPISDYRQVNVYSSILCIPCLLKMCLIDGATQTHAERDQSQPHDKLEVI